MSEDDPFAGAILALRPRLADIVIIGAWAHRLHRAHTTAHGAPPLMTEDLDIAVPESPAKSRPNLADLLSGADFEERLGGDENPPVSHWAKEGFKVEFLTPLRGSLEKRRRRDATTLVGGVTAQRIRHLDILLTAPWTVHLDSATSPAVGDPCDVLVANPTAFVVQKLLASERYPGDQAKDVLYVYDTLRLFVDATDTLRDIWLASIRPTLSGGSRSRLRRRIDAITAANDLVSSATEIARRAGRRETSADEIALACRVGLAAILG